MSCFRRLSSTQNQVLTNIRVSSARQLPGSHYVSKYSHNSLSVKSKTCTHTAIPLSGIAGRPTSRLQKSLHTTSSRNISNSSDNSSKIDDIDTSLGLGGDGTDIDHLFASIDIEAELQQLDRDIASSSALGSLAATHDADYSSKLSSIGDGFADNDGSLDHLFSKENFDDISLDSFFNEQEYDQNEFQKVVRDMEAGGYLSEWMDPSTKREKRKAGHERNDKTRVHFRISDKKTALSNLAELFASTHLVRSSATAATLPDDTNRDKYLQRSEIDEAMMQTEIRRTLTAQSHIDTSELYSRIADAFDTQVYEANTLFREAYEVFNEDNELTKSFTPAQLAANYFDYKHSLLLDLSTSALRYPIDADKRVKVEDVIERLRTPALSASALRKAMDDAVELFPEGDVTPRDFMLQLSLEHHAVSAAVEKYRDMTKQLTKIGKASQMKPAQRFVVSWFEPLRCAIEKELTLIDNNVRGPDRRLYGPYLAVLGASEMACIVIHEVLNRMLAAPEGVRFIEVALAVGKAVNAEVNLIRLREDKQVWSKLNYMYPGAKLTDRVVMSRASKFMSHSQWSDVIRAKVGSVLVHMLLRVADASVDKRPGKGYEDGATLWKNLNSSGTVVEAYNQEEEQLREDATNWKVEGNLADSGAPVSVTTSVDAVQVEDEEDTSEQVNEDTTTPTMFAEKAEEEEENAEQKKRLPVELPPVDSRGQLLLPAVLVPAFTHATTVVRGHSVGVISCHPNVINAIQEGHEFVSQLAPRLYPMVIPPRPWRGLRDGGYITVSSSIIRTKGSHKQADAVMNADIPEICDSLNKLGRVPWSINKNLLPIVEQVWEFGGQMADLPSRRNIPIPAPPAVDSANKDMSVMTPEEQLLHKEKLVQETKALRQWQRDVQNITQMNCDLHSLRCDLQLKLDQAKKLVDKPIYFPVNLDFRGRAYPIPPHLNHLGSDMARGLLTFRDKKPLGPTGLYWLYAHLAAQFGVDKVSFDDRVRYARSQWHLIKEAVEDPFHANIPNPHFKKRRAIDEPPFIITPQTVAKYRRREARIDIQMREDLGLPIDMAKYADLDLTIDDGDFDGCELPYDGEFDVNPFVPWWTTADAPWQALATCYEIYNAEMSGNPEEYECSLPVHQDGSCNGLQHYAALGRDEQGGGRVNLLPADKPQDVYTHVLNQVRVLMQNDINSGNVLAKMLLPHMSRKVVKQTVMTSVYGVTFIGARDQVLRQLKDLKDVDWTEGFTADQLVQINSARVATNTEGNGDSDAYTLNLRREIDQVIYQSAIYVARLTLSSLSTVFTGAKSIMTWLSQCAQLMAIEQQPVSWVTPLGLPVTQPYRKVSAYQVRTLMQTVTFAESNDSLPVSAQRQKAAFPPNFVHSLDATHMMLTSRECVGKGLTFSSVHDSFWTHAGDVDTMNASLRDQFVELYSQPILESLRDSFVTRFPHINFPPLPPRGTLDLNEVKKSNYFFS